MGYALIASKQTQPALEADRPLQRAHDRRQSK